LKDAEMIVAHCLGMDSIRLYRDNPEIPEDALLLIETFIRRRSHREPLQYILGFTEFYGLTIRVGPGVLIPRPETELLVEEAILRVRKLKVQSSKFKILDLCTGSGCIALALAKEFPDDAVYGTDISDHAMHYAEANARMNSIDNAIFLLGHLFEPVQRNLADQQSKALFDLIISNPPYIKTGDLTSVQPEIKNWEPIAALDGGEDGLGYYRKIIPDAINYLTREGTLILEIGTGQAEAVKEIARAAGYGHNAVRKDYAGIDRIITLWQ
jgi:release factor glutamine methyltransferase